jgi:hypothetical protein
MSAAEWLEWLVWAAIVRALFLTYCIVDMPTLFGRWMRGHR